MGRLAGFGDQSIKIMYRGTCHKHDPNSALPDLFNFEIDESYEETWGEGVSVFHNPRALHPLSREVFPSAAHHYMTDDGQITSYLPEFHPYSGITMMFQNIDDLNSEHIAGQGTEC